MTRGRPRSGGQAWLPKRKGFAKNTYRSYESHIRLYLVPYLGEIWLDELQSASFTLMFDRIEELRNSSNPEHRALAPYRRTHSIASMLCVPRSTSVQVNGHRWVAITIRHDRGRAGPLRLVLPGKSSQL